MRIAITGSSGLIGSTLVRTLSASGHDVRRLVRSRPTDGMQVQWAPGAGPLDPGVLAGLDAVINLAGPGLGDRRWTAQRKAELRAARIDATTTIATAIAAADPPPAVLLSASAIGWYGDTADREVDETAAPGSGFLADLAADWEAATEPATAAGTRVSHLRTGLVLAGGGGLLGRIRPLFRLGLGGKLGSGAQYWSWISLADEVAAITHLLAKDIPGPVNLTGPAPVTNAEFTRVLGGLVHRPTLASVPASALRAVLGDFADEGVLTGQRVMPAKLSQAGFDFRHKDVRSALAWALSSG